MPRSHSRVAARAPVEVGVHDLAHLPVGGREAPERLLAGGRSRGSGARRLVHVVAEAGVAQRAREAGEQVRRGGLVVPHVGAASVAAAARGRWRLRSRGTRRRRCGSRSWVTRVERFARGRVLDRAGQRWIRACAAAKRRVLLFQRARLAGGVFGGRPGVGEARGVVVADQRVFVALGRASSRSARGVRLGKCQASRKV